MLDNNQQNKAGNRSRRESSRERGRDSRDRNRGRDRPREGEDRPHVRPARVEDEPSNVVIIKGLAPRTTEPALYAVLATFTHRDIRLITDRVGWFGTKSSTAV